MNTYGWKVLKPDKAVRMSDKKKIIDVDSSDEEVSKEIVIDTFPIWI